MSDNLDPDDWPAFRAAAHALLDEVFERMETTADGPVWQAFPDDMQAKFTAPLPQKGRPVGADLAAMLPYGVGNTHPRFFGWVHGSGTATGLLADMVAGAMNANLGGRDHGAMYVEKQVVAWVRQMFSFPGSASGLIVSGTSMATIVALKTARDKRLGFASRKDGVQGGRLVGYTSAQAHGCLARAFDILGLGSDALRLVPVNADFEMDTPALERRIAADRAAGLEPFFVAGTAGSVNTGSFDDLDRLADIAAAEGLWLHVDGAFGAAGILSKTLRPRLKGLARADSLAFDFHKWLHVNYDAGFVLIRDGAAHRAAFTQRPDYLQGAARGLAAGNPWPVEYGPELSRGNRALKIWAQFAAHGTGKLGEMIDKNCAQARRLGDLVDAEPTLERLAPVAGNIVVFAHKGGDGVTQHIVETLQESGLAAPSLTTICGRQAIRVNITNHRTRTEDMEILLEGVRKAAQDTLPD